MIILMNELEFIIISVAITILGIGRKHDFNQRFIICCINLKQ